MRPDVTDPAIIAFLVRTCDHWGIDGLCIAGDPPENTVIAVHLARGRHEAVQDLYDALRQL